MDDAAAVVKMSLAQFQLQVRFLVSLASNESDLAAEQTIATERLQFSR